MADMTWQPWWDVAAQKLGQQAWPVIQQLQSISNKNDWTSAINQTVDSLNKAYGSDWQDPSRGSSPQIGAQIVNLYRQANPAQSADLQPYEAQFNQQGAQRAAQIQAEQNKPDKGLFGGGLGTILGIGGLALGGLGLAGMGPLAGLGEAAGAGAGIGDLAGEAAGLGISDLGAAGIGGAAAGLGTGAGMDWYDQFLQSIGIDPSSTMFSSVANGGPGISDLTSGVLTDTGGASDWVNALNPSILDQIKNVPSSVLKGLGAINSDGSLNSSGLASLLGKLGAGGLQYLSSKDQQSALTNLAQQYAGYGAPSRARFEASMTPGFDPMSIPGYAGALDTASKSVLAGLSAQNGNPFGNPGGLIDANKQIVSGTALPAIENYQRLNANTGFGPSMSGSIGLEQQAIGQGGNALAGIGSALGSATAPDNSLSSLLKQLQGLNLGGGNYFA